MTDPFSVFMSFVIVIGLMLLMVSYIKQLLPGPWRLVQRLAVPLTNVAIRAQARRRGWLFALFAHVPLVVGSVLIFGGTMTGTWQPILVGLGMVAAAWVARRALTSLHRLRRGRQAIPGRRRSR